MKKSLIGKISLVGLAACVFSLTGCPRINEPNILCDEASESVKNEKSLIETKSEFAPSNVKLNVFETKAILSWDAPKGFNNFTVSYNKSGSSEIASVDVEGSSIEFKDLEFGCLYDFSVTTNFVNKKGSSSSFSVTTTLRNTKIKIHSDILLLMYMDGDNNLNDPIFLDINEAEYGLSLIRNSDGSAKSGYKDVNVIALWDGFVGDKNTKPTMGNAGSHIYRLGADARETNDGFMTLGSKTEDLSSTASWLSSGEVNMGSRQTLVNFYKWALNYYEADHIYLQFSNHGGGSRKERITFTDDYGIEHEINSEDRRAMCWDDGSTNSFLKTKDVPLALSEAGMPIVDLIMEDVCLGANIEEAYELRKSSKYFLASPNNIPGLGFDYVNLFYLGFESDVDVKTFGELAVKVYKYNYEKKDADWNKLFSSNGINPSSITSNLYEQASRVFGDECSTLTFVDLSKMDAVKDSINSFANNLLSYGSGITVSVKNSNNKNTKMSLLNASKNLIVYNSVTNMYQGSFVWENDIGYFTNSVLGLIKNTSGSNATKIRNSAQSVLNELNDAILYAWKDGYKKPTYYKTGVSSISGYDASFTSGLTISGGLVNVKVVGNKATLLAPTNPSWYATDLQFGKDCKWNDLLTEWFGRSN